MEFRRGKIRRPWTGLDWYKGVWFKRFKLLDCLIWESLQGCLDNGEEWVVKERRQY